MGLCVIRSFVPRRDTLQGGGVVWGVGAGRSGKPGGCLATFGAMVIGPRHTD
jgi:hypothetical protein